MGGFAWVTLATNDSYSLGALVLGHSLRRAGTKHDLAVLITPGVTQVMRDKLAAVFSLVQEVNVLDSKEEANLALLARPELGITFTKLHCWRLTQYEKCVFVDADALVVRNCDELFEREELSAAPDVGWPDCFNSGVFVFQPSQQTFASLTSFAAEKGSFDGGDQGLLNSYFSDWAHKDISKHLPFIYNMCSTATYSYLPAYKQYGENARIIHFIGATKPWLQCFDTETGVVHPPSGCHHLQPLLQLWWNIFCENVHSQLSPVMAGLAGALAKMILGEPRSSEQVALEEHMRRQGWEQGQIDYMGRDSFENIWKKICDTLNQSSQGEPSPSQEDQKSTIPTESSTVLDTTLATKASTTAADETKFETVLPPSSSEAPKATPLPQGEEIQTSPISEAELKTINTPTMVQDEGKDETQAEITKLESAEPKDEPEGKTTFVVKKTIGESQIVPDTEIAAKEPIAEQVQVDIQSVQSTPSTQSEEKTSAILEPDVKVRTVDRISSPLIPECISSSESKAEEFIEASEVVTTPANLDESLNTVNELSALILDSSFVPIQVAESVLESEPKESVSEDQIAVIEEVISSIVAPVLESITAVSETAVDPKEPDEEKDSGENGNAGREEIENGIVSMTQSQITTAINETKKQTSAAVVKPEAEECVAVVKSEAEESAAVVKPVVEEKIGKKSASGLPGKKTEVEPELVDDLLSAVSESPESAPLTPPDSPSTQGPVRPARAKDPRIPTTPTVTEATPPNSPPIGAGQSLEDEPKTVKKLVKKVVKKAAVPSDESENVEAIDVEIPGKKIVKKVVKRVIKKPKEESADNGNPAAETSGTGAVSGEKPKKVVKIVKKIIKPSESLEVDNSVPETPPAGVPVPPKRKTKTTTTRVTTTTTTTSKKSPAEDDKPE